MNQKIQLGNIQSECLQQATCPAWQYQQLELHQFLSYVAQEIGLRSEVFYLSHSLFSLLQLKGRSHPLSERKFQVMWFLADFKTVEALRAIVKITLTLVSLGLVNVFKSCRQRVIFAVLVFFFQNSQCVCPFPHK